VHARSTSLEEGAIAPARSEIAAAFGSPLAARGLRVDISADPVKPVVKGGTVPLHYELRIGVEKVQLREVAPGQKGFVLEIVAGLAGPDGKWIKLESNTHFHKIPDGTDLNTVVARTYDAVLEKRGLYQVRFLVRDTGSKLIGTAARFIDVPTAAR
jgi:hypothetical protein